MITLAQLSERQEPIDDLAWPFDFSLPEADKDTSWVHLEPAKRFSFIAAEGSGGSYIAYGDGSPETQAILYASSEGQFGKIGSSLTEWLGVLTAIPYWQDLLKFSGGGKLPEMRTTAKHMESEFRNAHPDYDTIHERVLSRISVPPIDDPISTLHANIHSTNCVMLARDGYNWETLFNTFSPSDNPNWK